MLAVLPAVTTVEAAWDSPAISVFTSQSGLFGAEPVAVTVTSWAVSLWSVSANGNVALDGPVRTGVLVVTEMSPAALAFTRIEIGRESLRLPSVALTVRLWFASWASAGTWTSRRTVASIPGPASTPSTTKPPPWSVAVQPVGTPDTLRATLPWLVEVTLRSKLAFAPGATATAG
jgi:hypothetical protein